MFAGLPELGISNGDDLKETLTNCAEPLKAIDQFQVTTGFIVFVFVLFKINGIWLIRFLLSSNHGMRAHLINSMNLTDVII